MSEPLPIEISALAAAQVRTAETWWGLSRPKAPGAIRAELERASSLIARQPEIGTRARNITLMANTYVIDLRHYLDDETGDLADVPGPALKVAMFFASIVAWATINPSPEDSSTNVWCWRRPGRTRCRGEIIAERQRGSPEIWWHCPLCDMNGVIRGWEGSLWDRRRGTE